MGELLWHTMKERKNLAGENTYVFPSETIDSHIVDKRNAREAITESTGIEFTFHDLRRTFGTIANSLALGSYTIKKLINHTTSEDDSDVTDGYIQITFDDLRKAMNMIEDVVLSEKARKLIKNRIHFKSKSIRNAQKQWVEHNQKLIDNFITDECEMA